MEMGAKGAGSGGRIVWNNWKQEISIGATDKPFRIEKRQVYESYKAVKANPGAAGVDTDGLLFLSPERSIPRLCRILFCERFH
ncbi:hypothetical protein GOA59_20655 [Sinorhizobium meliloti]|nr:hypothetical protein [Sinorhizobium meliloti]MDW9605093.1 hypothetical protein [Sinorhizobium meliloti]MDW9675192.1 hypothetical protein [Sinorhizobium meliloti]MDW9722567.1 hypothetical protein [Sinorhizobium meliloti]MDW9730783.1 hypothetical protein [Sinorhizobium meliloti]